jgi:hypothetical protein
MRFAQMENDPEEFENDSAIGRKAIDESPNNAALESWTLAAIVDAPLNSGCLWERAPTGN